MSLMQGFDRCLGLLLWSLVLNDKLSIFGPVLGLEPRVLVNISALMSRAFTFTQSVLISLRVSLMSSLY